MDTIQKINEIKTTDVLDFIIDNPCAILATTRESGAPCLSNVFFYLESNLKGYFMSKIETRKIDNIFDNPDVTLMFSDSETLQQVEYCGSARIINDTQEIISLLPRIQSALADSRAEEWVPPLLQVPGDGFCIVEITPMSILYRDYALTEDGKSPHEYKIPLEKK